MAMGRVKMAVEATSSLCGSRAEALTSRMPSAPEAPALLRMTTGCSISLCLVTMAWITRAIWSEAPPAENGTTSSTDLAGFHCAQAAGAARVMAAVAARVATAVAARRLRGDVMSLVSCYFLVLVQSTIKGASHVLRLCQGFSARGRWVQAALRSAPAAAWAAK